jgi:hypothetical protein
LEAVESILNAWTSTRRYNDIVLGVDLNFTLPRNFEDITGSSVNDRRVRHPDRLQDIIRFLKEFGLYAVNTFDIEADDLLTHTTWFNKRGTSRTQIDYIFATKKLKAEAAPDRETLLKSDHYPIIGQIKCEERVLGERIRNYGWTGWTLESDEKAFKEDILKKSGFGQGFPMTEGEFYDYAKLQSLETIESAVKTAVLNSEFITGGLKKWKLSQLPEDLKAMKDSLWYMDGAERKETRKAFLKRRARWKAEGKTKVLKTMSTYRRNQQYFVPPSTFKVNGEITGDKAKRDEGLKDFIEKRYFDEEINKEIIEDEVKRSMMKTQMKREDGQYIEGINFSDVVFSRAAMSSNTAGGKDGLVGEIWKSNPFAMMVIIWFYFRLRAEYGLGKVSDAWRTWCLMGLPKTRTPVEFGEFRYICKSPVLQKWYLKSIVEVMQRTRTPSRVNTYGFRKGRGPMLITELLRRLLFLSHEWGPHVAIGSFDVKTAFDSMDHQLIMEALMARGVPEHLAAAFIRELMDLSIDVEIPGFADAKGIRGNRGGRQGGTDTTLLWNYLLEFVMDDLVRRWNESGTGFQFENGALVNHLIWADNIYLIANSVSQLAQMFKDLTKKIYTGKMRWKTTELSYITGSNHPGCDDLNQELPDGTKATIKYKEEMEVLGVNLDKRGSTHASMNHRLTKAEGCYGGMVHLLKDPGAPARDRLDAWSKGPVSSATYGAGGWQLSGHNLHDLRRWENKHIRGIMKYKPKQDEGRQMYFQRTNGMINRLLVKSKINPIYIRVLRQLHTWAKTWWNFKQDDGKQPLKDYMNTRPAADWETRRSMMKEIDYKNELNWRHQHSGKRLQWEDLYNDCLPNWRHNLSLGPNSWYQGRDEVMRKICAVARLQSEGFIKEEAKERKRKQQKKRLMVQRMVTEAWQREGCIQQDLRCIYTEQEHRDGARTIETITDNEALADIICGRGKPDCLYIDPINEILTIIADMFIGGKWGAKAPADDPVTWKRREFNKEADYLANYAMDSREDFMFIGDIQQIDWEKVHLIGWSDGGSRWEEGCSSSAWLLKVLDEKGGIQVVAAAAEYYDKPAQSSLEVEVKAKLGLWRAISMIEKDPHFSQSSLLYNKYSQNDLKDPHVSKRRRLRPIFPRNLGATVVQPVCCPNS